MYSAEKFLPRLAWLSDTDCCRQNDISTLHSKKILFRDDFWFFFQILNNLGLDFGFILFWTFFFEEINTVMHWLHDFVCSSLLLCNKLPPFVFYKKQRKSIKKWDDVNRSVEGKAIVEKLLNKLKMKKNSCCSPNLI